MSIVNKIKFRIKCLNILHKKYLLEFKKIYHLLELNFETQEATIQIKGKTIIFKRAITDIVCDINLIEALSPLEACWIGLYYGRILHSAMNKKIVMTNSEEVSFSLIHSWGRYKILHENRNKEISYIDTFTKQVYNEYPTAIIQNNYIINCFNPSQICYIGILAGKSIEKQKNLNKSKASNNIIEFLKYKPLLRSIDGKKIVK